ncbi:hypothetical protein AVO42_07015 [Thiomicrospira sp. XS5]|uniref:hypothetical protein n=1 Tax=Thiomicrospira sp. XS5 TaxID=1775636 RepID=UPI00074872FB|nr:hypothetical protein [Thiomicrospira sp. XS5]KUJ75098.1 hypothetical protein AVO42_07015 [Thiomicrospira sp. XS5]
MDVWSNKTIARDLRDLVSVIEKYDTACFFDYRRLINDAESLPLTDSCKVNEIELEFMNHEKVAKTIPSVDSFKINLISSLFSVTDSDIENIDPIESCRFDIVVTGYCKIDGKDRQFKNSWHLDKDDPCDGEQSYTHPLYHFQYGGRELADLSSGDMMLMATPRIPHPPMDIFLAIHFVLNNYFDKTSLRYSFLQDLYKDDDYKDIMERAKQRMWYSYFSGLSKKPEEHQELHLARLFPLAS